MPRRRTTQRVRSPLVVCTILVVLTMGPAAGLADPLPSATDGLLEDDEFLEAVERNTVRFFLERASKRTGLIADSTLPGAPSSIAAVGFGLTAICIGHARGWVPHEEAYARVLRILKTFRDRLAHERGFFYHFVDMETGHRAWNSEISSIDTAIFLAGALFAGEYFRGSEVERIANELYERVDWTWMMNGTSLLNMGWTPEKGFHTHYWDWYSEGLLAYALAIGSPTHPIAPEAWFAWKRPIGTYADYDVVYSYFGSLFTYQVPQAWIDFRDLHDGQMNHWKNSISAALANRHFCMDRADEHLGYGEDGWGLTAGAGPNGYRGYGAQPAESIHHDGTINPYGMVAAIPLVPYVAIPSLMALYERYGEKVYGAYGFKAGFNLGRDWWADHYIGIDQGVSVLMIENYRSGMVWDYFMRVPAIQRWVQRALPGGPLAAKP